MKRFLKYLLIISIFAAAVFLVFYVFYEQLNFTLNSGQKALLVFLHLAGLYLCYLINIIIHELSHVIFGKFNGFKLNRVSFSFLTFIKRNGKWRIVFKRSKYGGVTIMIPVSSENLYRKYALFVLGGLIGSLISALLFLFVLLFAKFTTINGMYLFSLITMGFPVSLYILFVNAISQSSGGLSTDGGLLYGILKKKPEVQITVNMLNIQSQLFTGLSPSEIDEKFYFNVPVVADNNINKIILNNLKYAYYLDKFDFINADKMIKELERLEEYIPQIYLDAILVDKFFNTVFYDKNNVKGEEIYLKIFKFLNEDINICNLRIKMAHELFVKDNPRLAIATGKTALSLKDEYVLPGIAKMEEKIINYLIEIAENAVACKEKKKLQDSLTSYIQ